MQNAKLLTLAEARARIPGRPSTETVWRWRRSKGFPSVKLNGRVFVPERALEEWLRANLLDATPRPEQHQRDDAELAAAGL